MDYFLSQSSFAFLFIMIFMLSCGLSWKESRETLPAQHGNNSAYRCPSWKQEATRTNTLFVRRINSKVRKRLRLSGLGYYLWPSYAISRVIYESQESWDFCQSGANQTNPMLPHVSVHSFNFLNH